MGGNEMNKKQTYEKPVLRKVRLEVKTSVLASCNVSSSVTPAANMDNGYTPCNSPFSSCVDYPR
jgi:hypothetical protein